MATRMRVAVTRRLPESCQRRLDHTYDVAWGDDARIYDAAALAELARGATGIIVTPAERVERAAIEAFPASLKVISAFSVGYEHIDIRAAHDRGITVTNTPGVLTDATAEIAMLLLLGAARRAAEGERMMRSKTWIGWRPTQLVGTQLSGKTLGIVGLGRIGAGMAVRAAAFGMRISYHNRRPSKLADPAWAFCADLDEMLRTCDAVSLHCPLTPETRNLFDARRIACLKPGVLFVNTARGQLVDDGALIAALTSGHVAAAGLDVYTGEPSLDPRYIGLENTFLLPHLGSATKETREAMGMLAIENLAAVLAGRSPPHPVQP